MYQVSPFDSQLYGQLLSDPATAERLGDNGQLRAMLAVEGKLALAQADAGLIPQDAARDIATTAESLTLVPADLAGGVASAGVPVPALVKALKAALPEDSARWVHFGATSQDIVDTALILNVREVLAIQEERLRLVVGALADLAEQHRSTLIAGRTRTQQAVPMSFGLKVAQWLAPLLHQLDRLDEMRPRLLRVQLGGAVGTLAAMGDQAAAINEGLAQRLDLTAGPCWHTQRDTVVELSSWLSLTTGTLGKMAQDWLWLAQSEVGELRFTNGGGSSTMPQKCNPVDAEVIVAMARTCASATGQMHQTMLQEHERSGSAWTQEWFQLPQQLMAASVALNHAREGLRFIEVHDQRMRDNLDAYNGVIYAESATFALARTMPRDQAAALVKESAQEALNGDRHLLQIIQDKTGETIDLEQLRQQLVAGGATDRWLTDILSHARP
ncbi:class-II fumarase/aspartase family protein [Marinobacter sp. JSM 1782161]|uniref:class-II fumarase/aspartase family protein n=1 Tax=Marinobacter sp. JSM 1782161 TaxID=2685906 RepID=UPI0014034F4B|nr:adenylosuccinate lyase family protein [Marinobacter sp. JSM 1782161]